MRSMKLHAANGRLPPRRQSPEADMHVTGLADQRILVGSIHQLGRSLWMFARPIVLAHLLARVLTRIGCARLHAVRHIIEPQGPMPEDVVVLVAVFPEGGGMAAEAGGITAELPFRGGGQNRRIAFRRQWLRRC